MDSMKKFFQALQGTWQLSRHISGSYMAHVTGTAVFEETMQPDELKYSEEVEITFAEGPTVKGYQHYIYRLEGDNTLNVYFDGGHRLFHSVEFTNSENKLEHIATHYCQPDTYVTSYFFSDCAFEIEHRVSGPKKDYVSHTTYNKCSPATFKSIQHSI
jgi:hypothetical protein